MYINVIKCHGSDGSCMRCSRRTLEYENVYKFNLGTFEARLCKKCIDKLRRGFRRMVK